jgi:very-short-patch-repair endonuclease
MRGWARACAEAFERDRDRDQQLAVAGYTVVRFSYRQLQLRPAACADRLRRLLA